MGDLCGFARGSWVNIAAASFTTYNSATGSSSVVAAGPAQTTDFTAPATPSFAGAAPGFSGLNRVNVTVPAGVAASQSVPLGLSQGGRAGATVTFPIR